jgi:hypothetical protein
VTLDGVLARNYEGVGFVFVRGKRREEGSCWVRGMVQRTVIEARRVTKIHGSSEAKVTALPAGTFL